MRLAFPLAAAAALGATAVLAQQSPEAAAVELRQTHMTSYAAQLRILGGMAQGNAAYDSAAAQQAADTLLDLAASDHTPFWLPGTAAGEVEGSNALPAIWENPEDFAAKDAALLEAATALQASAGTDLAAVQAGLGAVGQACGACQQTYRQPMN